MSLQLQLIKILSEYPYSKYKSSFLFRIKIAIKIFLTQNKKKKANINYNQYKYIFYVKDYGHLLRALEFRQYISKEINGDDILIILNSKNKKIFHNSLICFKKENIIKFRIKLHRLKQAKMLIFLFIFVFFNKFKFLLIALKIYKEGVFHYFKRSTIKNWTKNIKLISFNDQPIDISILNIILKEQKIITQSIAYQHGLIALPQFYFPVKSDYFYGYTKNKNVIDYFNKHNKYKTKFVAVGNLKYNKEYQKISSNMLVKNALVILTPSWKNFFKTINIIDKNQIKQGKYRCFLRLHPGMKFSYIAQILLKFSVLKIDPNKEVNFKKFDIVITEVSTMGFEALSEGKPIGVLVDLTYKLPYYFTSDHIPKIREITFEELQKTINKCIANENELKSLLKFYFG